MFRKQLRSNRNYQMYFGDTTIQKHHLNIIFEKPVNSKDSVNLPSSVKPEI